MCNMLKLALVVSGGLAIVIAAAVLLFDAGYLPSHSNRSIDSIQVNDVGYDSAKITVTLSEGNDGGVQSTPSVYIRFAPGVPSRPSWFRPRDNSILDRIFNK